MQVLHPTLSLNSPPIAALLQQWGTPECPPTTQPDTATHRALQWGQWLGTVGAIRLSRALHAIDALPADARDHSEMPAACALKAVFERTKAEVVALIHAPAVQPKPPRERADNTPLAVSSLAFNADFSAHGPRFLEAQKKIQTKLSALRAHLRTALAQGPRALQQLAALDAEMEALLGEREQRLWALMPAQLEKRLAYWSQRLPQAHEHLSQANASQPGQPPGGWLRRFEQEAQALLMAEMQARLQPIMGLLAAVQDHPRFGKQPQPVEPRKQNEKIKQSRQVNQ